MNGNGATIDGTKTGFRVFEVDGPGGNLSLQNVTITGGSADVGGGIENAGGSLTLNHSQVTGNTAAVAGGGIASATFDPASVARLTLNNSAVTGNSQTLVAGQRPGRRRPREHSGHRDPEWQPGERQLRPGLCRGRDRQRRLPELLR